MTFGRELFPKTKDDGCSKYAGLSSYTPQKYDLKRAYPWLTNVTRPGMWSNKKQLVEDAINRPEFLQRSVYPLDKAPNYQPIWRQVQGGLVSSPSPFLYTGNASVNTSGMSTGRKDFKNAYEGDASINSHNLGEILEAKVNRVLDYENVMSRPITNSFEMVDDGRLLRIVGSNRYYGSFLSSGHPCQIKDENNTQMDVICNEDLDLRVSMGNNYEKKTNTFLYSRVDGPIKDASRMTITDSKAIVDYPNDAHLFGATTQTNNVEPNAHPAPESNLNIGGNENRQKAHKTKKLVTASDRGPNIYPPNKNLLATGIFDGAPVQYTLRSHAIILHGVIKGSKILCSCNKCNNSKYISPSKFEHHAGGNTKKPYNYIYLQNGKTINQVLQELRPIPEDMLFDRLPEIAGSAFGWLSFNNWEGHSNLNSSPATPAPSKMSHLKSSQ